MFIVTHQPKGLIAVPTLASVRKVRIALVSFGAVAEVT